MTTDLPPPLTRREGAWAGLGCALAAAGFLSPALLTGRILSPAGLLFGFAPWQGRAPAGLGPGNPLLSDSVLVFEPWLAYAARRLHVGSLPLWNPDNMLGAPFLGNMQSAIFYPPNWLYFLAPGGAMLVVLAWLKLFLAALGMYGLARTVARVGPLGACIAALTFAFGAFLTVWLLYPLATTALWLPWLWWATAGLIRRPTPRRMAALAGIAALSVLAGHPETTVHLALATSLFALFYAWHNRPRPAPAGAQRAMTLQIGLWALAYGLGICVAAVQWLPFVEYLGQSAVLLGRTRLGAGNITLPLYYAWTLVSPDLFGNPAHTNWWGPALNYNEVNSYSGLLPLLLAPLAAFARRPGQRGLAGFLVALALLALGVVYRWPGIYDIVSALPLAGIGANHRLLLWVEFALALLAALGADAVWRRMGADGRRLAGGLGLSVAALGIIGLAIPALASGAFPLPADPALTVVWQAGLARAGVLLLLAVGGLGGALALAQRQPRAAYALLGLLPLLALADLWQAHGDYNPTVIPAAYFPATPATDFLQQQPGPFRVVAANLALLPNTNLLYGLSDLRGYDAVEPQLYQDLARQIDPAIPAASGGGLTPFTMIQSRLLNLLNVRYIVLAPGDPNNYVPDVAQEKNGGQTVGKIAGSARPGQTFVAQRDNLAQIQVLGATYGQHSGQVQFHLSTGPGAPDLVAQTLDVAALGDNAYWTISFPPIPAARGRLFYFYFAAPDTPPDQAVSLWYRPGDLYTPGTRMQDGQPAPGDLVFRTLAERGPDDPWLARVVDGGIQGASILENRQALPRAWLVHQTAVQPDAAALLHHLADPAFDPATTALLAAPPTFGPLSLPTVATSDVVTMTRYQPERVEIATQSSAPGLLLLSDQAFPGWTAQVDGQATAILTADYALRAVYVPAGAHIVRFLYAPVSVAWGALLSGGAVLLIVGLAVFPLRRRRIIEAPSL